MKLKDLVCLTKKSNSCYVSVVDLTEFPDREHIEVDLENGTWILSPTSPWVGRDRINRERGPFVIGSGVYSEDGRTYPHDLVGLFDRTDTKQLRSMASAALATHSSANRSAWSDD